MLNNLLLTVVQCVFQATEIICCALAPAQCEWQQDGDRKTAEFDSHRIQTPKLIAKNIVMGHFGPCSGKVFVNKKLCYRKENSASVVLS